MVIRAKDQASRVINSMSRGVSADFKRLQTAATITAQRSANDMARVRQHYAEQLLHQQRLLNTAMSTGNTQRVRFRQSAIRDLRAMQQEEVLRVRQEQLVQKEIMTTARAQHEAAQAALDAKRAAVSSAGTWITIGAGMAFAGAMGIKMLHGWAMASVEYQRQATLTQTQLGKQQASVEELQKISTSVARSVGVPIMQMQDALYDIFSSTDIQVKDSQGVLEKFAKAAVAGQVGIQESSSATISVMNGFRKGAGDLNRILDVQFAAVRLGRMTYGQFAAAIGKAIPSAVAANQSFETLAGSMAFLTRAGLTASQAAISFARLSDLFTRSSVPKKLREIGVEAFDATGKLRPINDLLTDMAKKFKPLDSVARAELFKKIFGGQGTIQARRFFNLAIDGAGELNKYINDVIKSTDDFQNAYNKMAASVAVKTIVLKNNWEIFKMQLGEAAIPVLNKLIEIGTNVLGWFNDMSPAQRRVIAATLALVSAVITFSGVLLALTGTVKMVAAGLGILRVSALATTGALNGVGAAGVVARFGLVGVAIGAVAIAGTKMKSELHKAADESERTGRMMTIGGKGGQFFAERVSGLTAAVKTNTPAVNDNYRAMSASEISAERLNERGIKPLTTAHEKHTKALGRTSQATKQVTELTKEQREQFQKLAEQIVTSGIEGMADRQNRIAEATRRLKEAQTELSQAQRGGGGAASSLSTAQERVHDASVRVEKAQISLRDKTKDSRLEHIRLREAQHDLVRAQGAARGSNKQTAGSLETVREASQRVKEAQKALKDAVGETAEETLRRFQQEAAAARNWSRNMRTLLKRGVDPAVVAELARQGPGHVAKFVSKGKAFYAELNRAFRERAANTRVTNRLLYLAASGDIDKFMRNGKLDVAALSKAVGLSMAQARGKVSDSATRSERAWKTTWGGMSRTTRAAMTRAGEDMSRFRSKANRELGLIKDEPVAVKATAGIQWSKDAATARFRAGRMAEGGRINIGTGPKSDDVLVAASKGETVVSAAHSARPEFKEWAKQRGIKGYAGGGLIGGVSSSGLAQLRTRGSQIFARIGDIIDKRTTAQLMRMIEKQKVPFASIGGPAVARTLAWARTQAGKPYIWGGVGPRGYDCSGWISALTNVAKGRSPHRRLFTTSSFSSGRGLAGFAPALGPSSGFNIGVFRGAPGHMAGTLGGVNVESSGSQGVRVGGGARGAKSGIFNMRFHLTGLRGAAGGGRGDAGALSAAERWIIMRESGNRTTADNPRSTAFGLGQLLISNRRRIGGILGYNPATTNYQQQLAMFRYYVKERYGTAERAQAFWRSHGWYHKGGKLPEDIFGVGPSGRTYSLQGGETVVPRNTSAGGDVHVHFHGPVYGGKAAVDQLATDIQVALKRKKRNNGGVRLGLD